TITNQPVVLYLAGSTERLTLTGGRSGLDRVQHAMARDGVVERGAEARSLAIVASESRVRLGDVYGRARALRRRPPILLRHGQDLERRLRALATVDGHLEDLGLAAGGGELQVALGTVDLQEKVRAARNATTIMDRQSRPTFEESGDSHLIIRGHQLTLDIPRDRELP